MLHRKTEITTEKLCIVENILQMPTELSNAQIVGIVVGVVAVLAIVIGLAVGLSVANSSNPPFTSGEFVPTRTTFLVSNRVTGNAVFPTTINGSFQAFLKQITYNATNPNNVVWFLTNNLVDNFVGNMIGTTWNYATPTLNQKLPTKPLVPSGATRSVDLAVTGIALAPGNSLPVDDLIPALFSSVVNLSAGTGTIELALPVTLTTGPTNYVAFAQNADFSAQPNLIISGAEVVTTSFLKIRYLQASAGAARINFVVCAINTFANFQNGVVYADRLLSVTVGSSPDPVLITLKNDGVSQLGTDPLWCGICADTSNANPYVTGIQQTADTSISLQAFSPSPQSVPINIICFRGVSGSFFTVQA